MARQKRNVENGAEQPFAKRLRNLIESKNVSQEELAKRIGISRQALNSYTLGQSIPDIERFAQIADYFDVSLDYLLGRSEVKKHENSSSFSDLGLKDESIEQLKNLSQSNLVFNGVYIVDEIISRPEFASFCIALGTAADHIFDELSDEQGQKLLSAYKAYGNDIDRVAHEKKLTDIGEVSFIWNWRCTEAAHRLHLSSMKGILGNEMSHLKEICDQIMAEINSKLLKSLQ